MTIASCSLHVSGAVLHRDPGVVAQHVRHRVAGPHVGQPVGDRLDVRARAADHGVPLRRAVQLEQAVVVEEAEEVPGGVVQRGTGAHRPHARHERHRVQPHERVREAVSAKELPVGGLIALVGPLQERGGPHLETLDLDEDRHEAGIERAARLGEHTTRTTPACELDAAALVADAHAHLGRARPNAELAEQPPQVGIRAVVVDDEPGVDREPVAGGVGHVVGVGVATETIVGFVEGHLVLLREHVGSGQTGDTGAHDGNRSTVAEVVRGHDRRPVAGKAAAQIRPQPAATAITFARDDAGTETPKPMASPASHATLTASAVRNAVPAGPASWRLPTRGRALRSPSRGSAWHATPVDRASPGRRPERGNAAAPTCTRRRRR